MLRVKLLPAMGIHFVIRLAVIGSCQVVFVGPTTFRTCFILTLSTY
jgi:hypothetical protein